MAAVSHVFHSWRYGAALHHWDAIQLHQQITRDIWISAAQVFINTDWFVTYTYFNLFLAYCAPCLEACGMCFSRIHVTNSQGDAPLPFGTLESKHSQVKNMK